MPSFEHPSESNIPLPLLHSMEGAKSFLKPHLLEVPWLWRMEFDRFHSKPQLPPDEFRPYWKSIRAQINLLRQIPCNRICLDCGEGWIPNDVNEEEGLELSRKVCWANVALGIFLCSGCAKLHQKLLPPSLAKILCLEWDTHYWTKEDLLKCARWGNYTAQKFWAHTYFSSPDNRDKFWQLSSEGYWCPRMPADEYIHRKYVEKRWAVSSSMPQTPLAKVYRRQEEKVISFVTGNPLELTNLSSPSPNKPISLMRRPTVIDPVESQTESDTLESDSKSCTDSSSDDTSLESADKGIGGTDIWNDCLGTETTESLMVAKMKLVQERTDYIVDWLRNDEDVSDVLPSVALEKMATNLEMSVLVRDVGIQTD